jgi:hypothetical protein
MSEEKQQILQMLQDGEVTSDQAMELLQALELSDEFDAENAEGEDEAVLVGEVLEPSQSPDMDRYRRFWQIPFFITLGALILSGLGLRSLYRSSEGAITFWFVCVWSVFIFMFLLTLMALLSRRATWLHVRVKERDGKRIAISMPLPLGLASWALDLARSFVGEDEREKLDMASGFLDAARDNLLAPGADPLMINVDDEDGDRVQVYIG